MGGYDDDSSTVVTVNLDEEVPRSKSGKPLSEKKIAQLSAAREKALHARRIKLKSRLEAKVSELRQVLGPDLRNDTIERVAAAMMKQEERLRSSQNTLTEQLNEALLGVRDELRSLRKMHMGHVARPDTRPATSKPAPRTLSEVSSRSLKLQDTR